MLFVCFFVKQRTAYEMRISDWSSDVCSSVLTLLTPRSSAASLSFRFFSASRPIPPLFSLTWMLMGSVRPLPPPPPLPSSALLHSPPPEKPIRSEERRGGKECVSKCRSRWSQDH